MNQKQFVERLEDVLDAMGLRTFEAPMTLDYRFGSFEAEDGLFRCFVNEDDVERCFSYLEIKGDHVYWVALDYPVFDEVFGNILRIGQKCRKILGRFHHVTFILAVEEGLGADRERLEQAFEEFRNRRETGVYCDLKIWDAEGLAEAEKHLNKNNT